MDEYDKEHAAWVHMCERLRELGIDVNAPTSDPLIGAIRQWGQAFRLTDDERTPDEEDEAQDRYWNAEAKRQSDG